VPSLDILDNVVPYIRNEEEKLITEPRKLLGTLVGEQVVMADMRISPSCNRVATRDGHLETLAIEFARKPRSAEEVKEVLRSFRSEPFALGCPSAVEQTIIVREEPDRPQTLKDRDAGHGMAVTVGRVRPCEVLDWKMVVLSHNTIRGAAGGSILNAEIMVARGMIG